MDERKFELVAKVPQVTLLFWIIKILATTLGEIGGDAVTMSWLAETTPHAKGTGYLIGIASALFLLLPCLCRSLRKNFTRSCIG